MQQAYTFGDNVGAWLSVQQNTLTLCIKAHEIAALVLLADMQLEAKLKHMLELLCLDAAEHEVKQQPWLLIRQDIETLNPKPWLLIRQSIETLNPGC